MVFSLLVMKMKGLKSEIDTALHYNMCVVGGFFGAYALLMRGKTFGSAQTGNLIELVMSGLDGDILELFIRLGAVIVYGAALVAAFLLAKSFKGDVRRLCICIEGTGIVLVGLLPADMNPVIALYPVFFMTAFQWGVFSGAKGYNSATIFSTNNMKQMLLGWTEYVRTKDVKHKEKALFYTLTLAFFHGGVVFGYVAVKLWSVQAAFVCLVPLVSAMGISAAGQAMEQRAVKQLAE